jgi:hypothetical protein
LFNPFPWYRPKEDPSARRVEPLSGGGLGRRQATLADRNPSAMTFALVAGIGFPVVVLVGMLVMALANAPPHVQVAGIVIVTAVVAIAMRGTLSSRRAARQRALDRATRHQERQEAGDVDRVATPCPCCEERDLLVSSPNAATTCLHCYWQQDDRSLEHLNEMRAVFGKPPLETFPS